MKKTTLLVAVGLFMWLTLSASVWAGGRSFDLTIVYSNNIVGQIEPCPT
jgi:hypothetical protein